MWAKCYQIIKKETVRNSKFSYISFHEFSFFFTTFSSRLVLLNNKYRGGNFQKQYWLSEWLCQKLSDSPDFADKNLPLLRNDEMCLRSRLGADSADDTFLHLRGIIVQTAAWKYYSEENMVLKTMYTSYTYLLSFKKSLNREPRNYSSSNIY